LPCVGGTVVGSTIARLCNITTAKNSRSTNCGGGFLGICGTGRGTAGTLLRQVTIASRSSAHVLVVLVCIGGTVRVGSITIFNNITTTLGSTADRRSAVAEISGTSLVGSTATILGRIANT
jgi:hypothetical protein